VKWSQGLLVVGGGEGRTAYLLPGGSRAGPGPCWVESPWRHTFSLTYVHI
jgi:hypothetical protein